MPRPFLLQCCFGANFRVSVELWNWKASSCNSWCSLHPVLAVVHRSNKGALCSQRSKCFNELFLHRNPPELSRTCARNLHLALHRNHPEPSGIRSFRNLQPAAAQTGAYSIWTQDPIRLHCWGKNYKFVGSVYSKGSFSKLRPFLTTWSSVLNAPFFEGWLTLRRDIFFHSNVGHSENLANFGWDPTWKSWKKKSRPGVAVSFCHLAVLWV